MNDSYVILILKRLLSGETLSSQAVQASNANQYFCTIKNAGIELIEVRTSNIRNKGTHLKRSLSTRKENIKRTVDYLKRLQHDK